MRAILHDWCVMIVLGLMMAAGPVLAQGASVEFLMSDADTQGSWKGVYGEDGYNIIEDAEAYPKYVTLVASDSAPWTWNEATDDVRALEKATAGDRLAACWFNSGTSTLDLDLTDDRVHQVAIYFSDWDSTVRTQTVEVRDADTDEILDSQEIVSFQDGLYLVWSIKGHVAIKVIHTGGANAVISGLFFDRLGGAGVSEAPTPIDVALDVPRDATLNWTPGEFAVTHDVYFGMLFSDVNEGTVATESGLDVNSFDPGRVEFGQNY
jgi:hypothetical protein